MMIIKNAVIIQAGVISYSPKMMLQIVASLLQSSSSS